jgi:SAM-dependent methyltransferase
LLDVLAHHAAAELLCGLGQLGVLDALGTPRAPAALARAFAIEPGITGQVLDFLARTTDVIRRRGGRYSLAPAYAASSAWRGVVDKLVAAYGPALRTPRAGLRGEAAIDLAALAHAYRRDVESPAVVAAIHALRPSGVLDLGCGRGGLLAAVCADPGVRGWGIDASAAMCRAARATCAAAGLARRVVVRRGAAHDVARLVPAAARARIDVLHAASLLNASMADRGRAIALLGRIARAFPGRALVVVDYLGAGRASGLYTRLTDLGQLLTGQGTPPATHGDWAALYAAAGGVLVEATEGRTFDLRWFVHVVRLPGSSPAATRRDLGAHVGRVRIDVRQEGGATAASSRKPGRES